MSYKLPGKEILERHRSIRIAFTHPDSKRLKPPKPLKPHVPEQYRNDVCEATHFECEFCHKDGHNEWHPYWEYALGEIPGLDGKPIHVRWCAHKWAAYEHIMQDIEDRTELRKIDSIEENRGDQEPLHFKED